MSITQENLQLEQQRRRRMRDVPDLAIRRARRSDMRQIADFVRSSASWYAEFVDASDMGEHEVDEAWEEKNFSLRDFYIGHADGEPVGTISLQVFGDYAYLGYIYLDVAHVGKGYGHTLMTFAESLVRRMGLRGMVLIAHPEATWATRAYEKFGFECIETDKDAILCWQDDCLKPYYEEGFELYRYAFEVVGDAPDADMDAMEVS